MDDDLKVLLVAIREEDAAAHAETRQQFETAAKGLRQQFEITAKGLQQQFEITAEGLRQQFEITAEGLRHEIQIVAEGVMTNGEKIDRFDAKINHIAADLETRVTRLEAKTSR